jgi:hypothetical protein
MFSSLKILSSPHAVTNGQLIWVDYLPYCTSLFVPARHAGMSQNIGINKILAIRYFSRKFNSQYYCSQASTKKW